MTRYKYFIIFLLFVWFIIAGLQSLYTIQFGSVTIPKSWLLYVFVSALAVLILDHLGYMNKDLSNTVLTFMLIYGISFNLVFAFDLYKLSPLVNRVEHFLGSILLSLVIYSFLSCRTFYKKIPSVNTKIMFLFFTIMTISTLNEAAELFMDLALKTKNIGPDLFDTNWDLFTNFAGSGTFLVIARLLSFI